MFRLEDFYCHPGFLDQPFVKIPSNEPADNIDFRAGDIIYENHTVTEWGRLGLLSSVTWFMYNFGFWPLVQLYKTHIPSEEMLFGRDDEFKLFSIYDVDKFSYLPYAHSIAFAGLFYTFIKMYGNATKYFPQKLQYNKNKDLLFATVFDDFGQLTEKTYELSNVERVLPVNTSALHFSEQDKGFLALKCLSTGDLMVGNLIVSYNN